MHCFYSSCTKFLLSHAVMMKTIMESLLLIPTWHSSGTLSNTMSQATALTLFVGTVESSMSILLAHKTVGLPKLGAISLVVTNFVAVEALNLSLGLTIVRRCSHSRRRNPPDFFLHALLELGHQTLEGDLGVDLFRYRSWSRGLTWHQLVRLLS